MITMLCAALLLACAAAARAEGEWLRVDKGVSYGETREGRKLYMNVYEPPQKKPHMPACISIHGGSWKEGDADGNAGFSVFLARQGMMVFDIDYRLTTEARWPAQIEDSKTAVRYVRSHCRENDVDPDRIMAAGGSAGAHLACLLAVLPQGKYEGVGWEGVSSSVQAVLNVVGPVDLNFFVDSEKMRTTSHFYEEGVQVIRMLAPSEEGDLAAMLREMSPVSYVKPGVCPHCNCYGGIDEVVMYDQGEKYHRALTAAGCVSSLYIAEGRGHEFSDDMKERAQAFCADFVSGANAFAPRKQ